MLSALHHPVVDGLGRRPATTVVEPPGEGPGYWAGGPSAVWADGAVWLAYRLRRPVDRGRGYANVVARSEDGVRFETVAEVTSADFACASLERPALAAAPDGSWRLLVSCSTEGSKHWWIEVLEATSPERFDARSGTVALAGDDQTAWKDPVVAVDAEGWHLWACRHPIDPPDQADRMDSWYGTGDDGLTWQMHGPALEPTPGTWDGRGARISAVVADGHGGWLALYDGRPSAEANWEELTGVASGPTRARFSAAPDGPLVSAPSLRYASPVQLPDGSWLVYHEWSRPDGAHDLRVEKVPRPTGDNQSA